MTLFLLLLASQLRDKMMITMRLSLAAVMVVVRLLREWLLLRLLLLCSFFRWEIIMERTRVSLCALHLWQPPLSHHYQKIWKQENRQKGWRQRKTFPLVLNLSAFLPFLFHFFFHGCGWWCNKKMRFFIIFSCNTIIFVIIEQQIVFNVIGDKWEEIKENLRFQELWGRNVSTSKSL